MSFFNDLMRRISGKRPLAQWEKEHSLGGALPLADPAPEPTSIIVELPLCEKCGNPFDEKCYICLEKLNNVTNNIINRCKTCNNYYHYTCIYSWLRMSPACTCPLCRSMWV